VETDTTRIAGILLAAGASSRMGRNKMLVELEGEALVHRAARRALEAGLDTLVVVVGHEAERVRTALSDLACDFVHNPDYREPTSGSLHRGLQHLSSIVAGAVVLLGDMPHVTSAMIERARTTGRAHPDALVVSRYGSVIAPPLLFPRTLFPELLAWSGEGAGKAVARRHLDRAHLLDWHAAALADIDTPDDLTDLLRPDGG
jgi:molybdenum cofactor cytidylyltransferase